MLLVLFFVAAPALAFQNDELPRRLENPRDLSLPGGSQVEFKSFYSPSLGQEMGYSVYLPPSYEKQKDRKFPVIYFLHGLFNDHTSWASPRYGSAPKRLEQIITEKNLPEFVMVHPDGQRSFYTDYADGSKKYAQYIQQDLIDEISAKFRVEKKRSGRAIAGTSMGGFGALKIAMKNPEIYASAAAGSPLVFPEDPSALVADTSSRHARFVSDLFASIYGQPFNQEHWKENNLEFLARTSDLDGLNIYFIYGTADRYNQTFPMEAGVRGLDRILTERGVSHTFHAFEGEPHGWELVGLHLEEMLRFLTQTF